MERRLRNRPKTKNGYYQISTGAELAYFRDTNISNWKAKLMCDIDMGGHNFASILNAGAEFDGCGHTIRGLNVIGNVYVGLFQAISSDCEIKNLTIENAEVKASVKMRELASWLVMYMIL